MQHVAVLERKLDKHFFAGLIGFAAGCKSAKLRSANQGNPDILEVPEIGLLKQLSAGEIGFL